MLTIVPIVLILGMFALLWYLVSLANKSIREVLDPVQQSNQVLGTQVANLLHPTPTVIPDPVTIIHQVRSIARLETIQYSVEKVVTAEVNQGVLGPLFGDRLLFVAHGYVIAGIDMSRIDAEDMWLDDGVLHVRLPPAEILVATLDNEQSYVYDRETGLFTHGDMHLETAARQVAEEEIRKAAIEDGILDLAMLNAEKFMEGFFNGLGYDVVMFE